MCFREVFWKGNMMSKLIRDEDIIEEIKNIVEIVRERNEIVNPVIRDDVFMLLQACQCTVLYYPLDGEQEDGCDGFHLEKPVNGEMKQFVFINTENTRERQAFSAAHELGHIWNVDKLIKEKFPNKEIDHQMSEDIINRFAAELLMPEEHFQKQINAYLAKIDYNGKSVKLTELIDMTVYLMNYFFVPYKAVIIRFEELNRLKEEYESEILAYKDSKIVESIIQTKQYTRLNVISRHKSLDNLQELLLQAHDEELISDKRFNNICDLFEFKSIEETSDEDVSF